MVLFGILSLACYFPLRTVRLYRNPVAGLHVFYPVGQLQKIIVRPYIQLGRILNERHNVPSDHIYIGSTEFCFEHGYKLLFVDVQIIELFCSYLKMCKIERKLLLLQIYE